MTLKLTNFNIECLKDKYLYVYQNEDYTNLIYIIDLNKKIITNKEKIPMYHIKKIKMRKSVCWEIKLKCLLYNYDVKTKVEMKLCISMLYVTKHIKDRNGIVRDFKYYYIASEKEEIKKPLVECLVSKNNTKVITFLV